MTVSHLVWLVAAAAATVGGCSLINVFDDLPSPIGGGGDMGHGAMGPGGTGGLGGAAGAAGAGGEECSVPLDCGPDSDCAAMTCAAGYCGTEIASVGAPCDDDGGDVCDGEGHCVKADGAACGEPEECLSGYCTDQVCCSEACTSDCAACDMQGRVGTCALVAAGSDPQQDCGAGTCDGGGACANGHHVWSQAYGELGPNSSYDVSVDANGSIVLAGTFSGELNLGGGALLDGGAGDVFVGKLGPNGAHQWSAAWGDSAPQGAYAVAVDSSGCPVVVGSFSGFMEAGTTPLAANGMDAFVVKLDPSGGTQWVHHFGDAARAVAVTTDPFDNILVAGWFQGQINFGLVNHVAVGYEDAFLIKLDSTGNPIWSRSYGGPGTSVRPTAVVALDDALIVAGNFDGSVSLGGSTLVSAGDYDVFVAKHDAVGNHVWSKRAGSASTQWCSDAAIDALGRVLLVGAFYNSIDLGGGSLMSNGGTDIWLAQLDAADGSHLYSYRFGDSFSQYAEAIATDDNGCAVMAGSFGGAVDFGGASFGVAGDEDVFVAKFGPGGQHLWSLQAGDADWAGAEGVAIHPSTRRITTVGGFGSSITFGGGTLVAPNDLSMFVVTHEP